MGQSNSRPTPRRRHPYAVRGPNAVYTDDTLNYAPSSQSTLDVPLIYTDRPFPDYASFGNERGRNASPRHSSSSQNNWTLRNSPATRIVSTSISSSLSSLSSFSSSTSDTASEDHLLTPQPPRPRLPTEPIFAYSPPHFSVILPFTSPGAALVVQYAHLPEEFTIYVDGKRVVSYSVPKGYARAFEEGETGEGVLEVRHRWAGEGTVNLKVEEHTREVYARLDGNWRWREAYAMAR